VVVTISYIDDYKARINRTGGNIAGSLQLNVTNFINNSFKDSPFYMSIPIDGTMTDVRIVSDDDKDPDKKTLLFRPQTVKNRGSIAVIDGYNWMIMDFFDNPMFPKASIYRCNEVLKWKDKSGNIHQYPCIVKILSDREIDLKSDKMFEMPYNKFVVNVQYNQDSINIILAQRFIFKQSTYKVVGKDDSTKVINGNGYISFVLEQTPSNPKDDFVNQIADNTSIYNGGNPTSNNQGGVPGQEW
jgi:hypothetical protein